MGDKFSKKLKFFAALAVGLSLFAPARTRAVNQNDAFLTTDRNNRSASDTSLQHSTTYAMSALMDLGNLNIKSAVNNGMTAYGKYRNSETLDKLGDANFNQANALSSVSAGTAAPRKTVTTFRRLDSSFLTKGEAGKVASEFEKKSGMTRTQFLSQIGEASERKISRSDPQLANKVIGHFENFIAKIPNKDFRESLQRGVNLVPETMRTGIIAKGVAKFATAIAGTPAATTPSPSDLSASNAATPAGTAKSEDYVAETGVPASDLAAENARAPASAATSPELGALSPSATASAESEKNTASENILGGAIQAALETQGQEPTIFELVTRRYRILTPSIH